MKYGHAILLALSALLIGGCNPKAPDGALGAPHASSQAREALASSKQQGDSRMTDDKQGSAVSPPTASSVLYTIYGVDGDGASSYVVDYDSTVAYWYGLAFDFKGKHYFTGFAYKTPEKLTDEEKAASPGPESTVALSQATFVLGTAAGKKPWALQETDGYVGEFGSEEKPLAVDDKRKPQSVETRDGRLLLAIPTSDFAAGVTTTGFALFVFDPGEVAKIRDKHWAYVGYIVTGDDNELACDEGNVMPCASSRGTLTFESAEDGTGLPTLQVAVTGTTIASPGKTRALGVADTRTYAYDTSKNSYTP